ncbi:TfoX/Sxy family protein [Pseudoruegeria sp. HB172150]|nr:TfoX/Sxy family protein [Pseudoruegeria sp. HB172150]
MAYDEGLAKLMRGDLAEPPGVTEKKMFGGLCFLLNGHWFAAPTKAAA